MPDTPKKPMMEKMNLSTPNLVSEHIAKIAQLFPHCVVESRGEDGALGQAVDFDALRQELSSDIVDGMTERYQMTWPGKAKSLVMSNTPIDKTLRPCIKESVNFDTTGHLFIEGDNLDALKLLQENYLGKIKMIYIDPPYNTGNDFVYNDRFRVAACDYDDQAKYVDEDKGRLVANKASNGRFHSDWLSMIYPRLRLARNLLSDDGVIFISIDDNEQANLKKLGDEIFGVNNFIGIFTINSTPNARDYGHIGKMHEYVIMYSKNYNCAKTHHIQENDKKFKYQDEIGGFNIHPLYNSNEAFHKENRPNLYYPFYICPDRAGNSDFLTISLEKKDGYIEIWPPKSLKNNVEFVWRWGREKSSLNLNKEILGYSSSSGEYKVVQKMRHSSKVIRSLLTDKVFSSRKGTAEVESIFGGKIFSFPKPTSLIQQFLLASTKENDTILDFFAGSGTTAHAVMALNAEDGGNRQCISVQLPEPTGEQSAAFKAGYATIADIAKERIRRAGQRILATATRGRDADGDGKHPRAPCPLDIGFRVLKIDSGNRIDVTANPENERQDELFNKVDNMKADRTAMDLLFGCMLDWGVDLSLPIRQISRQIAQLKHTVYGVYERTDSPGKPLLMACFDKEITDGLSEAIAREHQPMRMVFMDAGFRNDAVKINATEIFNTLSPSTEVKVI